MLTHISGISKLIKEKEEADRYGQTDPFTKVSGVMIRPMGRED